MDEVRLGGGSYRCPQCGITHFGSTVHRCEESNAYDSIIDSDTTENIAELCDIIINTPFKSLTIDKYKEVESLAYFIRHHPKILQL